jgi:YgiT-type zinc finger domain-containing protein
MKCFFCKGEMVDGFTTYMEEVNGRYIIIKHVPCHQCEQCGEVSYSGETVVKIERIINELEKMLTEVAIVEYAA